MLSNMHIRRRLLIILTAAFLLLSLLSAFSYANSLVSYKYEVQDTLVDSKPLNQHQEDILNDITVSKTEAITFGALCGLMILLMTVEPTFKGRISYK